MNLEIIGLALETLGTVMVAYMALRVHHRVWRERRVDRQVYRIMSAEQVTGYTGIILIIAGFILQLMVKL